MDRSAVMRAVRGVNTKPELLVRRLVTALGFRYRIHRRDIPGTPDLAFMGRRKVIFVHGCFWHGHDCPRGKRIPKTNTAYWISKIARNQERDRQIKHRLESQRWLFLEIWECETKDDFSLSEKLRSFLSE